MLAKTRALAQLSGTLEGLRLTHHSQEAAQEKRSSEKYKSCKTWLTGGSRLRNWTKQRATAFSLHYTDMTPHC